MKEHNDLNRDVIESEKKEWVKPEILSLESSETKGKVFPSTSESTPTGS